MREYTITKCSGTPNWASVPALAIDNFLWCDPVDIRAQAQICYDDRALHVRLQAWESHIRAEEQGPLGSPCEDSCLEFFFRPDPEDTRYFNIEFNPNGCMYLGYGNTRDELVRLLPEVASIVPDIRRFDDGWSVTYQIPYRFIRHFCPSFEAISGGSIRANCYKCGDKTVQPHYMAWNPIVQEEPAFHVPEKFGLMHFE